MCRADNDAGRTGAGLTSTRDARRFEAYHGAVADNSAEGSAEASADQSRILVVDDHEANVVLTRRILRKAGYVNVRAVTDSREALLLANSWQPDLVLLDLHMPHIGGTEFMLKLCGEQDQPRVPVLVVTGDDEPDALDRARRAGAEGCLVKPIVAGELVDKIHELLVH